MGLRVAGLAAAAFVLLGASAASADEIIGRTAVAGQAQWMDDYYGWTDSCKPLVYDIDVVEPPANGKVSPRSKTGAIPANAKIGSSGSCAGKPYKGWSLFYTAKAGYKGSDSFRVRMRVGNQSKFFVYRIAVR